jgi:hypothetical protein
MLINYTHCARSSVVAAEQAWIHAITLADLATAESGSVSATLSS